MRPSKAPSISYMEGALFYILPDPARQAHPPAGAGLDAQQRNHWSTVTMTAARYVNLLIVDMPKRAAN